MSGLDHAHLLNVLAYAPETGEFTWRVDVGGNGRGGRIRAGATAGSIQPGGYRNIRIKAVRYRAHRLAWFYQYASWPENHIDHINGDRSDNRLVNLRDVTCAVNQQNQRKPHGDSVSGYLGVTLNSTKNLLAGLWRAKIKTAEGKRIHLGSFATRKEAYAAYLAAKRKLHEGCTI